MKYAVVRIKGNQYKVAEGEEILVSKMSGKETEPEVLLMVNEDKVEVGNPIVKNAAVKIKVIEEEVKGEKLYVQKYKAKSRYRRKSGIRPKYTRIVIEKISSK